MKPPEVVVPQAVPFMTLESQLKRRRLAGKQHSRATAFGYSGVTLLQTRTGPSYAAPQAPPAQRHTPQRSTQLSLLCCTNLHWHVRATGCRYRAQVAAGGKVYWCDGLQSAADAGVWYDRLVLLAKGAADPALPLNFFVGAT